MTDTSTPNPETTNDVNTDAVLQDLEKDMDANPVQSLDGAADTGTSSEAQSETPTETRDPDPALLLPGSSDAEIDTDAALKELETGMEEHPVKPVDSDGNQIDLLDVPEASPETGAEPGADQGAVEVDTPVIASANRSFAKPITTETTVVGASSGYDIIAPVDPGPTDALSVLSAVIAIAVLNRIVPTNRTSLTDYEMDVPLGNEALDNNKFQS